uniref:Uncharacterized protein n=1 Tax=Anguilla anguilla TaxID=7936 RepID=A0A0E9TS08_ANGAN
MLHRLLGQPFCQARGRWPSDYPRES